MLPHPATSDPSTYLPPPHLTILSCRAVRELHLQTCDELGVEPAVKAEVMQLLDNLQQLLMGICIMQVMTDGGQWEDKE